MISLLNNSEATGWLANKALDHAILVIENYEMDVTNLLKHPGMAEICGGFCQGTIYKNALERIQKIRDGELVV